MALITRFIGIVSFGRLICPGDPLHPQFELFGSQYLGTDKYLDYPAATEFCGEHNGQLASLRTFEQLNNVRALIFNSTNFGTDPENSIWVGAVDPDGALGSGSEGANRIRFVYDDGSTEGINALLHAEASWATDSPNDVNGIENCLVLTGVGAQFLFDDVQCNKVQRALVCEYSCDNEKLPIVPKTADQRVLFDTTTVMSRLCSSGSGDEFALLRHDSGASFLQAELACEALGGHLASFNSQAEYLSLFILTNATIPIDGATWVGVYDPLGAKLPPLLNNINSSRFSFLDGSTAGLQFLRSNIGSFPWSKQNNLNDIDGLRNCALMSGVNGKDLLVTSCSALLNKSWCRFSCENKLSEGSINIADGFFDSVELASFQCQDNNESVEFRVINSDAAENFDTAELTCQDMGGHLASIGSEEELKKLGDVVINSISDANQLAWIGMFAPRFAGQGDLIILSFQNDPVNYKFVDGSTDVSFVHSRSSTSVSDSFPWEESFPRVSGTTSLSCVGISINGLLKTQACQSESHLKVCKFDCSISSSVPTIGDVNSGDATTDGGFIAILVVAGVVLGLMALWFFFNYAKKTQCPDVEPDV